MQEAKETQVRSPILKDPLKEMATTPVFLPEKNLTDRGHW